MQRAAATLRWDLAAGKVKISRKFAELRDGRRVAGPPKSAAAGDENRTRMTSLEDETLEALARSFPYVQRKV
jgi:hypothetical protein